MWIALIYILFIIASMLQAFKFHLIGLMPIYFTVAGVCLVMMFMIVKYRELFLTEIYDRKLYIFIVIYLAITSVFGLGSLATTFSLSANLEVTKMWDNILLPILFVYNILLIVYLIVSRRMRCSFKTLLLISLIFFLIKYAIQLKLSLFPLYVYRYYGIIDLLALFCWLLIVDKLMVKRYKLESR